MIQIDEALTAGLDPEVAKGLAAAATLGKDMRKVDRKFMTLVVRERYKLLAALIGLVTTATALAQGAHLELVKAEVGEAQAQAAQPDLYQALQFLEEKTAAATLVLQEAGVEIRAGTLYPPKTASFQVIAEVETA